MTQGSPIVHAMSFDIEDWFHMVEIKAVSDPARWGELPSLVVRYTRQILDVLDEGKIKATFFMLGWAAEAHPELVPEIAVRGHEIGTHSYWHRRVDRLSVDEFKGDMRRSIDLLERQSGKKILGFRAPSFSITPGTEWAFDALLDLGLVYDASLFPAKRGHGGYPCRQEMHAFRAPSGRDVPELPMSIMKMAGFKLPFSGGGYLRLLPMAMIRRGFRQSEKAGRPVVVYLHPRDFAPDCPRVPMPLHRRFKCYVGTHTTESKLRQMMREFRFDTCARVLGVQG